MEADDGFEWDAAKCHRNLRTHGIDFADVIDLFERPHLLKRSDRMGEQRYVALGMIGQNTIAVVFTWRDNQRRIVSARKASRNERKELQDRLT